MRHLRLVGVLFVACLTAGVEAQVASPTQPPKPVTPPAVPQAPKPSPDILPFKAAESTLANGLKVIVVPTGFPNIVSLRVVVSAGSRNEVEPGRSGFAHFFEHLMYRGTPSFPPAKFQEAITKAGARENAATGDDETAYDATFARDDLETMLRLYADMFQNLAFSEADFKTEATTILGEYNKNSANPTEKLFEVQRNRAFAAHPYKHTTMGFLEDIERMPGLYEYSKVFFRRWYRPQLTTLLVVGDVDPKTATAMIEKYWGPWKGGADAQVTIPLEPPPSGPIYAHVPWVTPTMPLVSIGFRAPAFSDAEKDYAAMNLVAALWFGNSSDLHKKLVVAERRVDLLEAVNPGNIDPGLFTILARVKGPEDVVYVRDEILKAVALARSSPVAARRLDEARAHSRYALARGLDSTERIAALLADFAHYGRSYATVNNLYRVYDSLTPADLQQAAQRYFTDTGLVVTTLSSEALPAGVATAPPIASLAPSLTPAAPPLTVPPGPHSLPVITTAAPPVNPVTIQKSATPQLDIKLLFDVGSAADPAGKEGLAALSAAMIARAGSKALTIDQIDEVLYPMAGSFSAQVDKEMTTFTGVVHRDNWRKFVSTVLPQLLDAGMRNDDFQRVKDGQMSALAQDLRSNNEEELAKERLQANIFRGTPYGHPVLGSVAGIAAITLDDVKTFVKEAYTRGALRIGVSGNVPDELTDLLVQQLGRLPAGAPRTVPAVMVARRPGIDVEIIAKDTRSTAISLGLPIPVTRSHPDFAALSVARAWLGEHRASSGRLYQRIREARGFNYGDYAYIEAFPRGMFQYVPDPNVARRQQIFEIWIRPVTPDNAHMALRIAVHELSELLANGMSPADFERTRDYLMKNVFVMTARQEDQLGYGLDSQWYRIGEFTETMRKALSALTVDRMNAAIREYWSATDLSIVIVTKDAQQLRERLVADAFSSVTYDGERPAWLLEEDTRIGALKLGIVAERVRITPVAEVFAK